MLNMLGYYYKKELITDEQRNLLKDIWDIDIEPTHMFIDYGTGIPEVMNILSYIRSDKEMSIKERELINRIEKNPKLTKSTSEYREYVEELLLHDLLDMASNKHYNEVGFYLQFDWYHNWKEFFRLYKIPYKKLEHWYKIEREINILKDIPKADKEYEFDYHYEGVEKVKQCYETSYKCYDIKANSNLRHLQYFFRNNYGKYKPGNFVGKLYYASGYNGKDGHWQIYVYDYPNSDNSLQVVLNYLENLPADRNKMIQYELENKLNNSN